MMMMTTLEESQSFSMKQGQTLIIET